MYLFFEFIFAIILYIIIVVAAYYVTEVKQLPKWLMFPPFHCRKCLTFWSNMAAFLIIGISFKLYAFLITGVILAILTAIAMHYDELNKTIKV